MTALPAPIFSSVGQALHVSYLMDILPVTQRGSTQVLIESLRQRAGKEVRAVGSLNLGGLTPLEFRGQCAMVRSACGNHLPAPELAAVLARFGWGAPKAEGAASLAAYLWPAADMHVHALQQVVGWVYSTSRQRQADRPSLRAIAEHYAVTPHAVRKAADLVRDSGGALERRAQERLQDRFAAHGLIPEPERRP